MKSLSSDTVFNSSMKVISACLPIITLGLFNNNEPIQYAASAVAISAMIIALVKAVKLIFTKAQPRSLKPLSHAVSEILSFPYAILLCSIIAISFGVDAIIGLILAAVLTIADIAIAFLPNKAPGSSHKSNDLNNLD
ncbi:MAG: hypothetical protein ACI4BH_01500 [Muribaculaceae bacterium]